MKTIIVSLLSVAAISLVACNSSSSVNPNQGHDMTRMENSHETSSPNADIKIIAVTYPSIDPHASAIIEETFGHYLHIQKALANDNPAEASKSAKALLSSLNKLDKSFFSANEKQEYDQLENHLLEHAKQIENNPANIELQRTQFTVLSDKAYEMVKAFGAGKPVYEVHCPMAMDNKGANWLSDSKEINNPYFGKQMAGCGNIQEAIQ